MQHDLVTIMNSVQCYLLLEIKRVKRTIRKEKRRIAKEKKENKLLEEKRTWWDRRPKECWTCREKFESGGLLHRHIRDNSAHGEYPYGCPYG
jgi:hypothetical protein